MTFDLFMVWSNLCHSCLAIPEDCCIAFATGERILAHGPLVCLKIIFFMVVKFSIYLNRLVFVMSRHLRSTKAKTSVLLEDILVLLQNDWVL